MTDVSKQPFLDPFEKDVILIAATRLMNKGVVHLSYKPLLAGATEVELKVEDGVMAEEVWDLLEEHYNLPDDTFHILRIRGYTVGCPGQEKRGRFITSWKRLDPTEALRFNA